MFSECVATKEERKGETEELRRGYKLLSGGSLQVPRHSAPPGIPVAKRVIEEGVLLSHITYQQWQCLRVDSAEREGEREMKRVRLRKNLVVRRSQGGEV